MPEVKLTPDEERVLLYLYEHKNDGLEAILDEIMAGTGLNESTTMAALRSLKEKGYIDGGRDILAETMTALKKIDANLTPANRGFSEQVILFASAISRANEKFLALELSYDPEFVGLVGSRLRNSGIWIGDSVAELHMRRWKESEISFFLDGAVAIGDLMIVGQYDTDPQYQMTESGKSQVATIIRDM